ncbi:MAG: hypothetical protein AAFU79_31370, partial [Myxococcota bacterium]
HQRQFLRRITDDEPDACRSQGGLSSDRRSRYGRPLAPSASLTQATFWTHPSKPHHPVTRAFPDRRN